MTTTVCKEHEWVRFRGVITSTNPPPVFTVCKNCGIEKPPIDFKIKQNLKVISDNEWEDIKNEFLNESNKGIGDYTGFYTFFNWIQENYLAPEKKNV